MKIKNSIKKMHIKKYFYDFIAQIAILVILTQVFTKEKRGPFGGEAGGAEVVHWELVVPVMVLFLLANILVRKNLDFVNKD